MSDALLASLHDPRFPPAIYGANDPPRPALMGEYRADCCVIGAGYTGLSAALHLARSGRQVVVLDAHRAGFGASGRNGGQLLGGQRQDQITLERMVGRDDARRLWQCGQDAVALVKALIAEGGIDCDLQPGAIEAGYTRAEVEEMHRYADHLAKAYDHNATECLDRDALAGLVNAPIFAGGVLDHSFGHLNPLAYGRGLARMAESAGARIFETSTVTGIAHGRIDTAKGHVLADDVILACNGYLGRLERRIAAHVIPINNYIAVTEPLPKGAALHARHCVADTRFVVNYFRTTADNRLIFGGGESYGTRFPADIGAKVRRPLTRIFPHLKDVRFDAAWGGTLAISLSRMPHFARPEPWLWSASGYSGHGIATATWAGKAIALAIQGDSQGFDVMARVPTPAFPGGTLLRWPALVLGMSWYALRDRLGL